jgi:hypothetical protein
MAILSSRHTHSIRNAKDHLAKTVTSSLLMLNRTETKPLITNGTRNHLTQTITPSTMLERTEKLEQLLE